MHKDLIDNHLRLAQIRIERVMVAVSHDSSYLSTVEKLSKISELIDECKQELETWQERNCMDNLGIKQNRMELDFAKHELNSLVALFNYDKAESMIKLNKARALCIIDCIISVMNDTKEYIEKEM